MCVRVVWLCSNVLCCDVLYDVTHQRRFLAEHAALAEVQCRTFQHKRSLLTAQYKMLRTCMCAAQKCLSSLSMTYVATTPTRLYDVL